MWCTPLGLEIIRIAPRFQFRLDNVLDLRTRELDEAQQLLAAEQQKHAFLRRGVMELEEQISELHRAPNEAGFNPAEARQRQGYIHSLRLEQQRRFQEINKQQEILNQYQSVVTERHQKQQTLEKLKEKQQVAFNKHQDYLEQEQLEEIALRLYRNNQADGSRLMGL
ncbi:MAG: flagellar FliJ family protein [Vampirovibrionales bacterium]|nr:flagellar FliJ family protein [Vampirovibrionales bacterium]